MKLSIIVCKDERDNFIWLIKDAQPFMRYEDAELLATGRAKTWLQAVTYALKKVEEIESAQKDKDKENE